MSASLDKAALRSEAESGVSFSNVDVLNLLDLVDTLEAERDQLKRGIQYQRAAIDRIGEIEAERDRYKAALEDAEAEIKRLKEFEYMYRSVSK